MFEKISHNIIWKVSTSSRPKLMKLRHSLANSTKILNVPDFSAHPGEDVQVVHNPASTWMHNEAGAVWVGGIVKPHGVCDRQSTHTPATHTHTHNTFHFGAALPCGVFSIMLLVLFTFNVTETENTAQQPFITKPWEIGGHASLSLPFSSLAVYLLHCSTLYPSINCAPFSAVRIHCLKFTHGTQKPPLHNTPPPRPLSVSIFHRNSLKGGIFQSTNGRDLIGKCYRGGGAVYCLLEERHLRDGVGRSDFSEQTGWCFARRWADAELPYVWNAAEAIGEKATEHS